MIKKQQLINLSDDFMPLLFASDINVYSVARAFHEKYGIKSHAYGKFASGPCYGSKIMEYKANPKVDEQDVFLELVVEFARVNRDKKILLIGCGDNYVQLISRNKGEFPPNVIAPYIEVDLLNDLINKEKFYSLCHKHGIPYPDTFVHNRDMGSNFNLLFDGPYIIKPSDGIEYWRHPFEGQKKVFKADSREELVSTLEDIYNSGYDETIIIQNFIPGDDTYMRVLTNYSDRFGKVQMMCMGHVLLEEHTPHGIGNHAVIMTGPMDQIAQELQIKIKEMLEEIGFTGFSNLDIKYDMRDRQYKVFEINCRQGRSNYYVTGAGANVAEYLVKDWVEEEALSFKLINETSLWWVIPKMVAFKYIPSQKYRVAMRSLIRNGKVVNPLFYGSDYGILRFLRLIKNQVGQMIKYDKYLGKNYIKNYRIRRGRYIERDNPDE
ncbi:MAG: ATP-grasp domain-containing protein [Anaerovoracaceae bacterium]|jgi:D-aspartate ligase